MTREHILRRCLEVHKGAIEKILSNQVTDWSFLNRTDKIPILLSICTL